MLVLLPAYVTLPVAYDASAVDDDPFPDQRAFLSSPGDYLGERVVVGGRVVATDPLRLRVAGPEGTEATVTVTGRPCCPATGDVVTAYGVLTAPETVRALNAVVVPAWGRPYAYVVSALAGLWTLARIVRHWRFDPDEVAFVRRSSPLQPWRLADRGRSDRRDDADA